jgi:hypothetical protein
MVRRLQNGLKMPRERSECFAEISPVEDLCLNTLRACARGEDDTR